MMDITVKIIFRIVPEGQVEEEAEVAVEDHGLIIPTLVGNPQIRTLNMGEEEIKIGEGDMDIIHNKINRQHMNIIIIHPKGNILIIIKHQFPNITVYHHHLCTTRTGSCDKPSFTTPLQQQANNPKASIP